VPFPGYAADGSAQGPFQASKAFLPALERARLAKIINVSSDMASIAGRWVQLGLWPRPPAVLTAMDLRQHRCNACYRISKAGVNQLTKTMAVDLSLESKVLALAVHPGFLPTRMTGYAGKDEMDSCMNALVETIERLGTAGGRELENGGYYRWDGQKMAY
jgi:NAD(P)-dependent dehydrogenase (short-subunit alcohol dehydrogenase family)